MKMANIIYEYVKTTKNKDAILCQNYVYNFKTENLDKSRHYVCSHIAYYSSLTILEEVVIKVNGQKATNESEFIHKKHGPFQNEEIISMNFIKEQ